MNKIIIEKDVDIYAQDFYQNLKSKFSYFEDKSCDVIYFEKSNTYGVFKYELVDSILKDNTSYVSKSYNEPILIGNDDVDNHSFIKNRIMQFLNEFTKRDQSDYSINILNDLFDNNTKNNTYIFTKEIIQPYVFSIILKCFADKELNDRYNINKSENLKSIIEDINDIFLTRESNMIFIEKMIEKNQFSLSFLKLLEEIKLNFNSYEMYYKNFLKILMIASIETTISLLNSIVLFSLKNTILLESFEKNISKSILEISRLYPSGNVIYRTTSNDKYYNSFIIPKDSKIALFIDVANRDVLKFTNPNDFNLDRGEKNLSFGSGPHNCLGKNFSLSLSIRFFEKFLSIAKNIHLVDYKEINTRSTINFSNIIISKNNVK